MVMQSVVKASEHSYCIAKRGMTRHILYTFAVDPNLSSIIQAFQEFLRTERLFSYRAVQLCGLSVLLLRHPALSFAISAARSEQRCLPRLITHPVSFEPEHFFRWW